jgi:hypothetical protein
VANVAQRSFSSGELAPALFARTDQSKYATGLRQCRNFLPQAHGGVTMRGGLLLSDATKISARRSIVRRFAFNDTDQSYCMEWGHNYLRFHQRGTPVVTGTVAAWDVFTAYAIGDLASSGGIVYYAITAQTAGSLHEPGVGTNWQEQWYALSGTTYEVPTPYTETDLPNIQLSQSADVVTVVCAGHPIRELKRYSHTRWTLSTVTLGPLTVSPTGLALSGGVAGDDTWYAVTAVSETTGEESLAAVLKIATTEPDAGTPIVVEWNPVLGAAEYNVYRSTDGVTFGYVGTAGGTPLSVVDTSWGTPSNAVTSTTVGLLTVSGGQARNAVVATAVERATDGKYRVLASLTLTESGGTSNPTTARVKVYAKRNTDAARVLVYTTPDVTLYGPGGNGASIDRTVDIADDGYTTLQFDLVPEVTLATGGTTTTATVTGTSVNFTQVGTSFSDAAVLPDYTQNPPVQPKLFDTLDTFPAVVGAYQERRLLAQTPHEPERVWASRTGYPASFAKSFPIEDDDLVSWSLVGAKVNVVRHLRDFGTLLVFTSGAVYEVQGDEGRTLTPTAINPRQVSPVGASTVPPVETPESLLYVTARGSTVRDVRPDAVSSSGYQGSNLSVYSRHLFNGYTIAEMDFAAEPGGVLWCARSDGLLLALTYLREHGVWGWSRHDTRGEVESVCVVPEADEDRLYCVVKRTINGATVRFVEQMAAQFIGDVTDVVDAVFMDCALTYDGTNATATTINFSDGLTPVSGVVFALSSAALFTASSVGDEIRFLRSGVPERFVIDVYTDSQHVSGHFEEGAAAAGPFGFGVGTAWTLAVTDISGLDHLEGEAVSVLGDGYVDASPNNADYDRLTVTGGSITLPQPRAVVHVGLPYLADLETLDLDTPSGRSVKEKAIKVSTVGLIVAHSRGIWTGGAPPTDDAVDPLEGLAEWKPPAGEEPDDPVELFTGYLEVNTEGTWNDHGRSFVRQVDPLPLTILAAIPQGNL